MEVVVRPYTLDDAPAVHEAIIESIEHLRPWMPWAALEPLTLDERRAWLGGVSEALGIFVGDTCVGGTGLHDRIAPTGREIGYWVRVGWTGRGIATEAARQVIERAFAIDGVDHVEIHHDKANLASRRVPEKLGFTLEREVEDAIAAPGESGISCEWRLTRDRHLQSPPT
jgi:RimJ/RimL family protein N-acetyltransferase